MREKHHSIQSRLKRILAFVIFIIIVASVTPVLADYIGPNRTVTETVSVCHVNLNECKYVASKDAYRYRVTDSWPCADESKPWRAYSNKPSPWGCTATTDGDTYWSRTDVTNEVTTTYPPATIDGSLLNCTLNNGWCITPPQLALSGSEPVSGYNIIALEGSLNGQNFACPNANCSIPLVEGNNDLTYWALSSFGDSSTMGTATAKVDSQAPMISGLLSGTAGSNGWYLSPASFNGSASDPTSGLASFTCTLDGAALGSCSSIAINGEGLHTLVLTARDNAGNVGTLTKNAAVDTRAPNLSASLNGTIGPNNWYTSATLNATASDPTPGSGLLSLKYKLDGGNWISFPGSGVLTLSEGIHTVNIQATDNAGRTVSTSKAFSLDSGKPDVTVDSTGTLGSNNWYITMPNVSASASDNVSGLDVFEYSLDNAEWTTYTAPLDLSEGAHNVSFWAQDKAGLVKQVDRSYQVDTNPPQIAGGISGILGLDDWYISEVTLSASSSDPTPGSGMDAFTYILDGSAATSYTDPLTLSDGQHTIEFNAQDQAGLTATIQQNIKVDTVSPSLTLSSTLPTWSKGVVTFSGTAADDGSGLSNVEISMDAGTTWQTLSDASSWNYEWNTQEHPDGSYPVQVRATDKAGLATETTVNVGLDNHAPTINLPNSWFQWDTVTLNILDDYSGIATAHVEISDPQGRWPQRVIELDPQGFPLSFKWDRRFGDETIAPADSYNIQVTATDNLGNTTSQSASITVLIDILPPGPTVTPQVFSTPQPTATPTYVATATSLPLATPTATKVTPATARVTPTTVIHTFGVVQPATQVIVTPTILAVSPTPRMAPTQNTVSNWLESFLAPTPETAKQTTELVSFEPEATDSKATNSGSNVLWGATAAAMVGAATAYAAEERRRQQAAQTQAELEEAPSQEHMGKKERDAIKAEEKERRHATVTRHMQKLEARRAQEAAWEQAQFEQALQKAREERLAQRLTRADQQEYAAVIAAEEALRKKYEDKKKAKEQEELNAGLAAYYNATRQGETAEKSWVDHAKSWGIHAIDWVDNHQTEIALGLGVAVGVAAIVLSGGIAGPLLAAAYTVSAAAMAAGTVAAGTVMLNKYYGRAWNENLVGNMAVAGLGAAVVAGAWFTFQIGTTGLGAYMANYCDDNPAKCANFTPVFKAIDMGEEFWLRGKMAYQKWKGDDAGALDTLMQWEMEQMDGDMPGNTVSKEVKEEIIDLGEDGVYIAEKYGKDTIPLLLKYREDAIDIIGAYGEEGIALLQNYGDDAVRLIGKYGTPAVKTLAAVEPKAAETLLESLDKDVLEYAAQQGDDAMAALAAWGKNDLKEHGVELALRAKKDAQALADVKKLASLGPIDPKKLTDEQRALIDAIAKNSTQYDANGQIVLGKWLDYGEGFIADARDTGSRFYGPHPDVWNTLESLGPQNQNEAAWLINQQAIQNGIHDGLPFEFSLNGLPVKDIGKEHEAIETMFSGATENEILDTLNAKAMPFRMKELRELKEAGYQLVFDATHNSYIFALP